MEMKFDTDLILDSYKPLKEMEEKTAVISFEAKRKLTKLLDLVRETERDQLSPDELFIKRKNYKLVKHLLKKVLDTYNHYADSQKERNLSAPMVSTWLNGKNWEEYSTTTTKNDFPIVKDNTVRLKNLSDWVTADPPKRVTSVISDDDVKEMLENKIIEQHHFDRWMNG